MMGELLVIMNKKMLPRSKKYELNLDHFTFEKLLLELNKINQFCENVDGTLIMYQQHKYGYYDDISTLLDITVFYDELESDEEYEKRIVDEQQKQKNKLKKDKEQREARNAAKELLLLSQNDPKLKELLSKSGAEDKIRSQYKISKKAIL